MQSVKIRVRYQETDQMGVVYHSNYFVWFEIGRTELFRGEEFTYHALEEAGFAVPVTEVGCKYLKPAKYDDLLTIETTLAKLSPVRMEFTYKVRRQDELLAKGFTRHAIIDPSGRPCNLQKKAPTLWAKLQLIKEAE